MRRSKLISIILVSVGMISGRLLFSADWTYPFAESSLSGLVISEKGEPLEGVLVRTKREGATKAVTVISDAQGRYRFPKLQEAGRYIVETARADGLEPSRESVEIKSGHESHVNLRVGPAKDMARQMTAVDWLLNVPGTPEQKRSVEGCMGCHTLTLMNFRFDKESWLKIVRMMTGVSVHFANLQGEPTRLRDDPGAPLVREMPGYKERTEAIADFLAKVRGPEPLDLSNAKLLPRPKGRSTRAVFTEYDIPYDNAEPHDLAVDSEGTVWFTDWRWGTLGKLNPATEEMKYWVVPALEGKKEEHPGTFQVAFDQDGNPWTTITWTGGLAKFDRKTEKFTTWAFPNSAPHKLIMTQPDNKRGRVWFDTHNYYGRRAMGFYAPKTGELRLYEHSREDGGNYGVVVDSKGNAYGLKIRAGAIGRIDAETGEETIYRTPTPNSGPRRGNPDSEDRIWFAESRVDQVGVFDPRTGQITEYKLPIPMADPYSSNADRRTGLVWTAEFSADRFATLDPKTGEMWEYLLPTRDSRVRIIDSYSTGDHSVIWYGALPVYGNGTIVKLEAW